MRLRRAAQAQRTKPLRFTAWLQLGEALRSAPRDAGHQCADAQAQQVPMV